MSTDTDRTLEMTDWQAYQFHRERCRVALAFLLFGAGAVFVGALAGNTAGLGVAYYGSAFAIPGILHLFAYEYDGRIRRLADWNFRLWGDDDYPWSAHDVEVTHGEE